MYTLSCAFLVIIGNSFQLVRCAPSVALLSCVLVGASSPVGPVALPVHTWSLFLRPPKAVTIATRKSKPKPGVRYFCVVSRCTRTELRKSVNCTELCGN